MWKFYYNLVFQNLVFNLICVNKTNKQTQRLMQKFVQLDNWTWYKYFIIFYLHGAVLGDGAISTLRDSNCVENIPTPLSNGNEAM